MTDNTLKVRPKEGLSVPFQDGSGNLPHGKDTTVPKNRYWNRLLLAGDVVVAAPKPTAKKD